LVRAHRAGDDVPDVLSDLISHDLAALDPPARVVLGAAAAIATLQSSVLPRWTGYLAVLFAFAHFGATVSWARDGAFSQTGAFPTLAPLVYLVWVVAVSIVLLRARDPIPVQ
jgi:hypothetical protein